MAQHTESYTGNIITSGLKKVTGVSIERTSRGSITHVILNARYFTVHKKGGMTVYVHSNKRDVIVATDEGIQLYSNASNRDKNKIDQARNWQLYPVVNSVAVSIAGNNVIMVNRSGVVTYHVAD